MLTFFNKANEEQVRANTVRPYIVVGMRTAKCNFEQRWPNNPP